MFETVQPRPSGKTQQITTDLINSGCINLNRLRGKTKKTKKPQKNPKNHGAAEENRAVSSGLQAVKPAGRRRSHGEQLEGPTLGGAFVGDPPPSPPPIEDKHALFWSYSFPLGGSLQTETNRLVLSLSFPCADNECV